MLRVRKEVYLEKEKEGTPAQQAMVFQGGSGFASEFNPKCINGVLPRPLQEEFLLEQEISDLQVNTGATTPVFVNEEERKSLLH